MRWLLSREAEQNLIALEDYTARRWGDEQAEKYLRAIEKALDLLAEKPALGHARPDIPPPYLSYGVGSHLIVYRHHQAHNRLEVLTVLHPAMDLRTRVKALLMEMAARA